MKADQKITVLEDWIDANDFPKGDDLRRLGRPRKTHGQSYTPEYTTWRGIRRRCLNPKCKLYPNYGGRGIQVCDRWRYSFENFFTDMGLRPSNAHSIDRIDVDGHYSPENCRWATVEEQSNNKRHTRYVTYQGKTQSITQWSRELNRCVKVISTRLDKGCSVEYALTGPLELARYFEYQGRKQSAEKWVIELNLPFSASQLRTRIKQLGMTFEEAISTPRMRNPKR